jgi:5-methylcytosine-specific restriction endonuclease McrA
LEYQKQYNKQYRQDNPEKVAARNAKYRALKQDGIPEPLRGCPIEKGRLEQIYKLRDLLTKATGIQYHVDHIWPLSKGGPHWSGNLQIITAEENLSKHDTLCEDTARVIGDSLDEYLSSPETPNNEGVPF